MLSALLVGAPVATFAAPPRSAQASAADADITAKVKAQIDAQSDLKGMEIDVTTDAGVVTLKGVVPSALMRAKVGELTKNTEGVSKVNNKLTLARK
jgi:osmotically-inducible protein OsmY